VLSLCCLGGVGRFGLLGQLGKARGVVDGDVGQDLAVQLDAGLLQAVDELRVAEVPFSLAAAEMRTIHRERNWRFFWRRPV
jgi:hypothetical protein